MSEYNRKEISEEEKIDLIRIINDMWKGFKRFWLLLLLLTVALGWSVLFQSLQKLSAGIYGKRYVYSRK